MISNRFSIASFQQVNWLFTVVSDFLGTYRKEAAVKEQTDEELANAMRTGDDHAFEQLYDRYFGKIYAFLVRRVSDAHIAEDLTADVFMKAFVHRKRFVWTTSFSAWIYRIATNRLIDHYRTKPPTTTFDPAVHDQPSNLPPATVTIDQTLLREQMEQVLSHLLPREQMVIGMKYFAELSPAEIAEALHLTANNVGVILHRALKKCQEHL